MISITTRVTVPKRILFRQLQEESVLLEPESGQYFGLNETGTRMWSLLAQHGRIELALAELRSQYDVPFERLQEELLEFVDQLASQNLLELHGS
jgi:hypothetical protein